MNALGTQIDRKTPASAASTGYPSLIRLLRHARAASACVIASVFYAPVAALSAGSWVNGQSADVVLGQSSFTAASEVLSAAVFKSVAGVAVDAATGKVFISDGGHRVLRFSGAAAASSGASAEAWFGQATADVGNPNAGGVASAKTLATPQLINVDAAGRLWVADRENNRVLRFDNAATKATNSNADAVLGQSTFSAVLPNRGGNVAANTMYAPNAVWSTGSGLWVADGANNRILGFSNAGSKANGAGADVVLGQADFVHNASGSTSSQMNAPVSIVVSNSGTMFVADLMNARVLRFDNVNFKGNGASAESSLGYSGPANASSMAIPAGVALDASGRLYVSDVTRNRVLIFNDAVQKVAGVDADNVLGQSIFTGEAGNSGGLSARSLSGPQGLAFDGATNALLVADFSNGRVLRFSPVSSLLDIDAS